MNLSPCLLPGAEFRLTALRVDSPSQPDLGVRDVLVAARHYLLIVVSVYSGRRRWGFLRPRSRGDPVGIGAGRHVPRSSPVVSASRDPGFSADGCGPRTAGPRRPVRLAFAPVCTCTPRIALVSGLVFGLMETARCRIHCLPNRDGVTPHHLSLSGVVLPPRGRADCSGGCGLHSEVWHGLQRRVRGCRRGGVRMAHRREAIVGLRARLVLRADSTAGGRRIRRAASGPVRVA